MPGQESSHVRSAQRARSYERIETDRRQEESTARVEHGYWMISSARTRMDCAIVRLSTRVALLFIKAVYCGGAIRPTTTAAGSTPGVGLSTTVSASAGMIPISGRMVNP